MDDLPKPRIILIAFLTGGRGAATAAQLICRQLSNQGNQQDSEIARGFVNEVAGWIDVPDKASCKFDRELAERLIY